MRFESNLFDSSSRKGFAATFQRATRHVSVVVVVVAFLFKDSHRTSDVSRYVYCITSEATGVLRRSRRQQSEAASAPIVIGTDVSSRLRRRSFIACTQVQLWHFLVWHINISHI